MKLTKNGDFLVPPTAYFGRFRSLILGLRLLIIKSILTNSGAGIQGYDLYLSASP